MPRHSASAAGGLRGWVPRWWQGEGGAAGRALDLALWPAELLFRAGVAVRNRAYDTRLLAAAPATVPVISIGNLAVGGTGKTPVSAWVAARLRECGRRPAVVLRGYGQDEILVHRELNPEVPVIAAPRRRDGVQEAVARRCDVVVLDDAFQHRALQRDLDVVLIAAEGFHLPLRLLPRGPWREGVGALRRAGLVLVTRKTASAAEAERVAERLMRAGARAVARCHIAPGPLVPLADPAAPGRPLELLAGRKVVAVASLADPRPMVRHLEEAGARVELIAFPDHHDFSPADVEAVLRRAAGRPLVTTRKEAVKLRPLLGPGVAALMIEQQVRWEAGAELFDSKLAEALRR